MTENKENNVSNLEPDGVAGNPEMSADQTAAGAPQQRSSQEQSPNHDSLSEGTRQIIIAAAKSSQGRRPSRITFIALGVAFAGFVIFQIVNHYDGTVIPAQVLAQPDQRPQKPQTLADSASFQQEPTDSPDALRGLMSVSIDTQTVKTLDEAVSLQTARSLYQRGDYEKAYYVYDKLRKNVTSNGLKQQS